MLPVSRVFSVFALAALGAYVQAQGNESEPPFALQSPSQLVQCKNTAIIWQGGKPPYKVTLTPVCGAGKNASEDTHSVDTPGATSIEIPVRFAENTPLIVSITDSANMQAAAPQTIVALGDGDNSCKIRAACTDAAQAPSAPIAAVNSSIQSTSSGYPTDRLVTTNPSATSVVAQSATDAFSSGSTMVVIYSYASQTPTPSASSDSSLQEQPNAATLVRFPTFVVLGLTVFVGANLAFGL